MLINYSAYTDSKKEQIGSLFLKAMKADLEDKKGGEKKDEILHHNGQ